jgi:hypothetical protein
VTAVITDGLIGTVANTGFIRLRILTVCALQHQATVHEPAAGCTKDQLAARMAACPHELRQPY